MSTSNKDFFVWPTTFSCILVVEDLILPSEYNLSVGMVPQIGGSTTIGLKKIKEFISKFIQNSILISQEHQFLSQLSKLQSNTVQLPCDPSDYFFASVLFHKLTAISKDYFSIGQITIDSSIGDRVKYQINDISDAYYDVLINEGWWNQDNVNTNKIDNFPSWEDLNIEVINRFSPKLINGGKNENKSVRRSDIKRV
jgi:hypothetical protein